MESWGNDYCCVIFVFLYRRRNITWSVKLQRNNIMYRIVHNHTIYISQAGALELAWVQLLVRLKWQRRNTHTHTPRSVCVGSHYACIRDDRMMHACILFVPRTKDFNHPSRRTVHSTKHPWCTGRVHATANVSIYDAVARLCATRASSMSMRPQGKQQCVCTLHRSERYVYIYITIGMS